MGFVDKLRALRAQVAALWASGEEAQSRMLRGASWDSLEGIRDPANRYSRKNWTPKFRRRVDRDRRRSAIARLSRRTNMRRARGMRETA